MLRLLVPFIVLSLLFLGVIESWNYPLRSKIYPLIIIGSCFVFVVLGIISDLKKIKAEKKYESIKLRAIASSLKDVQFQKQIFMVISTILYSAFVNMSGFIIISTLYLFFNFYIQGVRSKFILPIISIMSPIILYIIFGIYIKIPLPRGPVEKLVMEVFI